VVVDSEAAWVLSVTSGVTRGDGGGTAPGDTNPSDATVSDNLRKLFCRGPDVSLLRVTVY